MSQSNSFIARREVIEAYVIYDASKKQKAVPTDMAKWPWLDANALDNSLAAQGFKHGILAGFAKWKSIELSRSDLMNCAIVNGIFPNLPQTLSILTQHEEFQNWRPNRTTGWFQRFEKGHAEISDWPLILRPAVKSEAPAKWYIEDGSGRAICFLRWLLRHPESDAKAWGYLGVDSDKNSIFMQKHFPQLLQRD